MKRAECKIGMTVRDTRNGTVYKVIGERVHATDCGAWVEAAQADADGFVDGPGLIHWSHLEPISD